MDIYMKFWNFVQEKFIISFVRKICVQRSASLKFWKLKERLRLDEDRTLCHGNKMVVKKQRIRDVVTRCVTRRGAGGGGLPSPFSKIGKSALICGKKCPDFGHLWVKFSFFLRVSRRKYRIFFPCGASFSCVIGECLSKCPNSKKTSLP